MCQVSSYTFSFSMSFLNKLNKLFMLLFMLYSIDNASEVTYIYWSSQIIWSIVFYVLYISFIVTVRRCTDRWVVWTRWVLWLEPEEPIPSLTWAVPQSWHRRLNFGTLKVGISHKDNNWSDIACLDKFPMCQMDDCLTFITFFIIIE